MLRTLACS